MDAETKLHFLSGVVKTVSLHVRELFSNISEQEDAFALIAPKNGSILKMNYFTFLSILVSKWINVILVNLAVIDLRPCIDIQDCRYFIYLQYYTTFIE